MTNHPITPPPELVQEWTSLSNEMEGNEVWMQMAIFAAQWSADQELKACCEWMQDQELRNLAKQLRAARRPKPPSLKEQALRALDAAVRMADDVPPGGICSDQADIIHRALEQLDG
jgi:hypothetical protein